MSSPPSFHSYGNFMASNQPSNQPSSSGSLFGQAITSIASGINTALWTRLETAGDVSDDAMSLSSLTLDDSSMPILSNACAPAVSRSSSVEQRKTIGVLEALDAHIAMDAAQRDASALPEPVLTPRMGLGGRGNRSNRPNLSTETILEDATDSGESGLPRSAEAHETVESFVQLDDARNGGASVAYCFFRRDETATVQTKTPDGRLLRNMSPVFAKPVHADAVVWTPLLGNDGAVGHCFFLELGGVQQARIEAFFGDDATAQSAPTRIAVVNALSTPMALAARLVDRGSMVEFSPPHRHASKLKILLDTMTIADSANDLYCPVSEVVLGPALHETHFAALLQLPPCHADHAHFGHAKRAWNQTVTALRAISDQARRGVQWHNRRELHSLTQVTQSRIR